jgi:hypothetical protein
MIRMIGRCYITESVICVVQMRLPRPRSKLRPWCTGYINACSPPCSCCKAGEPLHSGTPAQLATPNDWGARALLPAPALAAARS